MKLKALVLVLGAGLLMTACSYFDTAEEEVVTVTKPPAETIDLTITQPDVDNSAPENPDNIEVYSLPAELMVPVTGGEVDMVDEQGYFIPANHFGDPSVEVYPLDEAMRGLMSAGYVEAQKRLYPSPFAPETSVDTQALNPSPAAASKKNVSSSRNPSVIAPSTSARMTAPSLSTNSNPPNLLDAAEPEYVTVTDPSGQTLRVFFGHNSVYPDPQYNGMIADVAQAFMPAPGRILSIEGHASQRANVDNPTQRKIVNLKVSAERAFNVARLLMESGVAQDHIRIVGWGESRMAPLVPGLDPEGASRRVEILQAQ